MTDIVYTLGKGSKWQDSELKYSLRSVERYATHTCGIYIIGKKPDWIQDINYVPFVENSYKEKNILDKILQACKTPGITNPFLFINDDHFFVESTDISKYPNYTDGYLQNAIDNRERKDEYQAMMIATLNELKRCNLPTLNYDIHCPMLIDKAKFPEIMSKHNFDIPNHLLIKSLYGNAIDKPEFKTDIHFYKPVNYAQIENVVYRNPMFSVSDGGLNDDMKLFLSRIFQDKSKFEV